MPRRNIHARLGGGYRGVLRAQHDLVDFALAWRKVSVNRQGTCNVGGIAAIRTRHVHDHHVAVLHLLVVGIVVQNG